MGKKEDIERNTFEVWEKHKGKSFFLGNGGIVKENGGILLVSPAHVIFEGSQHNDIEIRMTVERDDIPKEPKFTKVHESDLALVELPSEEGLPIAEKVNLQKPLHVRGSIIGEVFDRQVNVTHIGGKKVNELPDPAATDITGTTIVHYEGISDEDTFFAGTSGGLILDSEYHVVGLHVVGKFSNAEEQRSRKTKKGFGWVIKGRKQKPK